MKKQSAAGLFFSMFLRAIVIIMGIIIIGFSIFFLMKVKQDKKKEPATPATTVGQNVLTEVEAPDELLTGEPSSETEATEAVSEEGEVQLDAHNAKILVLNSTDVMGLAGRWCATLNEDGYASTTASDFHTNLDKTVVYSKQEGVGTELVNYFDGASYEVGDAPQGASISTADFDIVIIIGNSDDAH